MALPPGFVDLANQRYIEARRFWGPWRGRARDDYAFVSGNQWLEEDKRILETQKRPPITFNYSEKMIDAVVGAEVSSRQEITYGPRDLSDSPLAELMTNACKWVRDQGNIEDEETDAFRDALICGLGWTHTKVSYEQDHDGMIETHRIDPIEMSCDPAARKPGLTDRRYSFRDVWVDEREARKQWPTALTLGTDEDNTGRGIDVIRQGHRYEDEVDEEKDNHKDQVQLRHYECVELEPYYRVQGDQGLMDVESSDFGKMRDALDKAGKRYVKMMRRVYYYAWFAGETFLEGDKSPTQEGFTYGCITGKRDRNTNTWYGLTKVMKDPQRWANKWLSQILHIINSNAKGGLIAERGAFVDPKKAAEEWSMPESITFLNEGAIDKIQQKEAVAFPTGLDKLMEFALASLPQVTGINLEALGLAARDQANVLEQSRKQAAYGLLAPVFDSLRRYRKTQGRIIFDFIRNYISDGRLIRIGGPESQRYAPLVRVPDAFRYDIVVDQSPNAPDVKEKTWQILESLIPAAMKAGLPIPPTILKYAPIPTALALEWQQTVQQSGGGQDPGAMQKMQEQVQQLTQENQQLQMQLKDKSQELQMAFQQMQAEIQLKQQAASEESKMRLAELQARLQLLQQESQAKIQTKTLETQANIQQSQQELEANTAIKAYTAEQQAQHMASQPNPKSES